MHLQDITCVLYMSGGLDEKALKVSNYVVPIIDQLRFNHEEAAICMLLTRPDKAQKGLLWQVQILMCLFYLYIILVALAYVEFSLIQEGKEYPCTKKWFRITFADRLWL